MSHPNTVQQLLAECPDKWTYKTFRPGDFIYQPDDVGTHLYLLEKGFVKIGSLGDYGQRVLYDLLQPGDLFGDLDYLDDVTFFEFAQATTSVALHAIDRSAFRYAVTHNPLLAGWFSELIVRRWYRAEVRLLHRSGSSVDERILQLEKQYARLTPDVDGQLHRPFDHLSYQDIGDLVGATRQTVSRKLQILSHPQLPVLQ